MAGKLGLVGSAVTLGQQVYPTKATIDHYCDEVPSHADFRRRHSIWLKQ